MARGLLVLSAIFGCVLSAAWIVLSTYAVWLWPGVLLPRWRLAAGWLVYAAGLCTAIAMAFTPTLPGPVAPALAVGAAALVVFGVLRLRRRNAWVFFICLGVLSVLTVGGRA